MFGVERYISMPKLFRDLLKMNIRPKKELESYIVDALIEMKAADRCFLETGRQWEDLSTTEHKKVIELVKEELQKKNPEEA